RLSLSSNGFSWDLANAVGSSKALSAGQWYDLELGYSNTLGYKLFSMGCRKLRFPPPPRFIIRGG
ncbi:hypothetical protein, partial [Salmonella enterica]|uniref:hypothetical protein n=1 Tax=Salmonella enterica TaxID=28901 RepID=UPI003D27DAE9